MAKQENKQGSKARKQTRHEKNACKMKYLRLYDIAAWMFGGGHVKMMKFERFF